MGDLVFLDAVYWFLMDYNIKLFLIGTVSVIVLTISFFHTIRKWGEV